MKNNTEENKYFSFTPENLKIVKTILLRYPNEQKASAVMPLLDLAMRQIGGWLTESAMKEVSKIINIPYIRVLEVASFYSMYNLKPIGKYFVQVCTTTSCWLRGSDEILNLCKKHLKIDNNQTTPDGMFTLKEVECLGACVNAPMVQINDDYYEDLTNEGILGILENLKKGLKVKVGTQSTLRVGSEPFSDSKKVN
jgi:NADH-quinone oxidoreductase subunit E